MRNQLLISLCLVAVTSNVFAKPSETVNHDNILEIALTGSGVQVATDNTAYGIDATSFSSGVPRLASSGNVLKNDPKYKFEGTFLIGYYFQNSSINVNASYTGTHNQLNNVDTGAITGTLIPPVIWFQTNNVSVANASNDFDYDYVNLEIGSLTQVNCNRLIINPQLGISFARLKNNQAVEYAGGELSIRPMTIQRETLFNGLGASLAIDLDYRLRQSFSLIGNFRYNALAGSINSSYTLRGFEITPARPQVPLMMDISVKSKYTLVNLFQTELGLGYDFNISNMFCGNFAIGYQFTKSIGSAEQIQFIDDRSSSNFIDSLLNTSLYGYFARITMDFSV